MFLCLTLAEQVTCHPGFYCIQGGAGGDGPPLVSSRLQVLVTWSGGGGSTIARASVGTHTVTVGKAPQTPLIWILDFTQKQTPQVWRREVTFPKSHGRLVEGPGLALKNFSSIQ